MAGQIYDCHSPEFIERKARATEWMQRYNALPYSERSKRYGMLKEFLGSIGTNVSIGDNVTIGAESVLTKDIPSNSVAVGNLCKVIKEL